jgi:hypothetical protein
MEEPVLGFLSGWRQVYPYPKGDLSVILTRLAGAYFSCTDASIRDIEIGGINDTTGLKLVSKDCEDTPPEPEPGPPPPPGGDDGGGPPPPPPPGPRRATTPEQTRAQDTYKRIVDIAGDVERWKEFASLSREELKNVANNSPKSAVKELHKIAAISLYSFVSEMLKSEDYAGAGRYLRGLSEYLSDFAFYDIPAYQMNVLVSLMDSTYRPESPGDKKTKGEGGGKSGGGGGDPSIPTTPVFLKQSFLYDVWIASIDPINSMAVSLENARFSNTSDVRRFLGSFDARFRDIVNKSAEKVGESQKGTQKTANQIGDDDYVSIVAFHNGSNQVLLGKSPPDPGTPVKKLDYSKIEALRHVLSVQELEDKVTALTIPITFEGEVTKEYLKPEHGTATARNPKGVSGMTRDLAVASTRTSEVRAVAKRLKDVKSSFPPTSVTVRNEKAESMGHQEIPGYLGKDLEKVLLSLRVVKDPEVENDVWEAAKDPTFVRMKAVFTQYGKYIRTEPPTVAKNTEDDMRSMRETIGKNFSAAADDLEASYRERVKGRSLKSEKEYVFSKMASAFKGNLTRAWNSAKDV